MAGDVGFLSVQHVGDANAYVSVYRAGTDRVTLTGEGIHAALLSGILAAESILGGTGAEERYNEACRKQVTPIFGQARLARSLLFREPFRTLALRRFKRGKGAMRRFLGVLAGESDYKRFFLDSLLGR